MRAATLRRAAAKPRPGTAGVMMDFEPKWQRGKDGDSSDEDYPPSKEEGKDQRGGRGNGARKALVPAGTQRAGRQAWQKAPAGAGDDSDDEETVPGKENGEARRRKGATGGRKALGPLAVNGATAGAQEATGEAGAGAGAAAGAGDAAGAAFEVAAAGPSEQGNEKKLCPASAAREAASAALAALAVPTRGRRPRTKPPARLADAATIDDREMEGDILPPHRPRRPHHGGRPTHQPLLKADQVRAHLGAEDISEATEIIEKISSKEVAALFKEVYGTPTDVNMRKGWMCKKLYTSLELDPSKHPVHDPGRSAIRGAPNSAPMCCQVAGCKNALVAKPRHRICRAHSQAEQFEHNGGVVRWCHECHILHDIDYFADSLNLKIHMCPTGRAAKRAQRDKQKEARYAADALPPPVVGRRQAFLLADKWIADHEAMMRDMLACAEEALAAAAKWNVFWESEMVGRWRAAVKDAPGTLGPFVCPDEVFCKMADNSKSRATAKYEVIFEGWLEEAGMVAVKDTAISWLTGIVGDGHLFRPDFVLRGNRINGLIKHLVILEVDENKHAGAAYAHDREREAVIGALLGIKLSYLRVNPNSYVDAGGEKVDPAIEGRKPKVMEWLGRLLATVPDRAVSVYKMYFDEFDGEAVYEPGMTL